jgi:hypothetical protein
METAFAVKDPGDGASLDHMREVFGPAHVDLNLRQSLQSCWMALPPARRTADELERQFRRLVDRALRDMREDMVAFGPGDSR